MNAKSDCTELAASSNNNNQNATPENDNDNNNDLNIVCVMKDDKKESKDLAGNCSLAQRWFFRPINKMLAEIIFQLTCNFKHSVVKIISFALTVYFLTPRVASVIKTAGY